LVLAIRWGLVQVSGLGKLKILPIRMRIGKPIINFFPIEFETGRKGTA